jgi:hypothetical protein
MNMSKNDVSKLGNCSQLYRHTVPIFDFDRSEPLLIGSGVFIYVNEYYLVCTAAHVLEEGCRKIAFGVQKSGIFEIFGADDMRILTARPQVGAGDVRRVAYKDDLDLALIEPVSDVLERLRAHYRFFDLAQNYPEIRPDWGVVSGWPARKNVYDRRKRGCNFDTCYHIQCPVVNENRVERAGWNRDIHFGLGFDKAKDFADEVSGQRIHLPKLEGVSGAGFWVPRRADALTASEWSLAGIVVEDDEPHRMLKAIKIEHLWTLLRYWH